MTSKAFQRFIGVLILFSTKLLWAYSLDERPDIFSKEVENAVVPSRYGQWSNQAIKKDQLYFKAMIPFIAELLALYPEERLYFLARDAEFLYDAAKILNKEKPEVLKRFELITVTTETANKKTYEPYLHQFGFEMDIQEPGVVLVDTCCWGSIFDELNSHYMRDKRFQGTLSSHNLYGGKLATPSSLVFMQAMGLPVLESLNPRDGAFQVRDIESHLEHYFEGTTGYIQVGGKIYPNGKTSYLEGALWQMASFKKFIDTPEAQKKFAALLKSMSALVDLVKKKNFVERRALTLFRELRRQNAETFIWDLEEAVRLGKVKFLAPSLPQLLERIKIFAKPKAKARLRRESCENDI